LKVTDRPTDRPTDRQIEGGREGEIERERGRMVVIDRQTDKKRVCD
jgi:hypothetical protein